MGVHFRIRSNIPASVARSVLRVIRSLRFQVLAMREARGLGVGWFVEEHEVFGLDFPEPKGLVDRYAEASALVDRYLTHDQSSFDGGALPVLTAPTTVRLRSSARVHRW